MYHWIMQILYVTYTLLFFFGMKRTKLGFSLSLEIYSDLVQSVSESFKLVDGVESKDNVCTRQVPFCRTMVTDEMQTHKQWDWHRMILYTVTSTLLNTTQS